MLRLPGMAMLLSLMSMPALAQPAEAATGTAGGGSAPGAEARLPVQRRLDEGWLFFKGDPPAAMQPAFDDRAWRRVRLPHDWSMDEPFRPEYGSGNGYAAGGLGWYRLALAVPEAGAGQRVTVQFDGVMGHSQVWLNGHRLGGRPNGYLPLQLDLTPYLRQDAANVLAVRVDRSRQTDSRWFTGSGLYRAVHLRVHDALHIAPQGVFVHTPEAGAQRARVQVATTVANAGTSLRQATLLTELLSPAGQVLAQQRQALQLAAGAAQTLAQSFTLASPQRWSPAQPQRHSLRSRLLADGGTPDARVLDAQHTPFGVREVRFTPDRGLFINGEPLKLRGVALHHDAGSLGAAVPVSVLERRLRQLQALGVNAIRTSHNPPAPELLDLCDQLGLLVQVEALDEFTPAKNKWVEGWNIGLPSRHGQAEHFEAWAVRDVTDMVRRDRNHPSVIMWSIGNEIDYPNDPFSHPVLGPRYRPHQPPASELLRLARPLVAAVRAADPTRPVTAALASLPMSEAVGLPGLFDLVGYNYQEARYAEDHARHPQRVIYGSENSHDHRAWLAVRDLPYISAQFLWTGFDYLGEARAWPQRGADFGLFDLAGFLKPRGAFREALWSPRPVVHLAVTPAPQPAVTPAPLPAVTPAPQPAAAPASAGQGQGQPLLDAQRHGGLAQHWNWPAGTGMTVLAYANTPEVQLWLNGQLVGSQHAGQAVDGVLSWQLPHAPGELLAIGMQQGRELARTRLRTAGPAAALRLALAHAGSDGVVQLVAEVVDAQGQRVPDAATVLQFTPLGAAEILGIGNGNLADTDDPRDARHALYQGRALAVLRRGAGQAGLRIAAPGLGSAELAF